MKIAISYPEVEQQILKAAKAPVKLSFVDRDSVNVAYGKKILLMTISVKLTVVRIQGNDIFFKYDCGAPLDMVISGITQYLTKSKLGEIIEPKENHTILVHLQNIPQLKKALEILSPKAINFTNDGIALTLAFND